MTWWRGVFWGNDDLVTWCFLREEWPGDVVFSEGMMTWWRGVFWGNDDLVTWCFLREWWPGDVVFSEGMMTWWRGVFWGNDDLVTWCFLREEWPLGDATVGAFVFLWIWGLIGFYPAITWRRNIINVDVASWRRFDVNVTLLRLASLRENLILLHSSNEALAWSARSCQSIHCSLKVGTRPRIRHLSPLPHYTAAHACLRKCDTYQISWIKSWNNWASVIFPFFHPLLFSPAFIFCVVISYFFLISSSSFYLSFGHGFIIITFL